MTKPLPLPEKLQDQILQIQMGQVATNQIAPSPTETITDSSINKNEDPVVTVQAPNPAPKSWYMDDWRKRPGENREAYRKRVGSKTRYAKGRLPLNVIIHQGGINDNTNDPVVATAIKV